MKAKKELMLSAPIFNNKNIVRDFDPELMGKILQPNKIETVTENDEAEDIEIIEPDAKPKRKPRQKKSGPKAPEVIDE